MQPACPDQANPGACNSTAALLLRCLKWALADPRYPGCGLYAGDDWEGSPLRHVAGAAGGAASLDLAAAGAFGAREGARAKGRRMGELWGAGWVETVEALSNLSLGSVHITGIGRNDLKHGPGVIRSLDVATGA